MTKKNNEQILANLLNTTTEFKRSYDSSINHINPLPIYEDERLELEQRYLSGMICGLIELISRKHEYVSQYYNVIKDYPSSLLDKMLQPNQKEMIFAVGEKEKLNSQMNNKDSNQKPTKKTLKM
jgi:hypothetical protein